MNTKFKKNNKWKKLFYIRQNQQCIIRHIKKGHWSKEQIVNVINNPSQMGTSINRYTGNECLVYFNEKGGYVVVDNVTGKIVQISQYDMSDFIIDKDITILPK